MAWNKSLKECNENLRKLEMGVDKEGLGVIYFILWYILSRWG